MDWTLILRQRLQAALSSWTEPVVVVAASGGADSMALLDVLARIAPELGLTLHVACLDHGWRQSRAPELVAAFCRQHDLPLTVGHLPAGWAPTEGRARDERRRFLAQVAAAVDAQAVVLAHHGSDQAETVLAHLIQGGGDHGLRGMRPWSEGLWLRPLLDVPGSELRSWTKAHELPYEDDPTNAEGTPLRNWIRREIMPALAARQPQIERLLIRAAQLAAQDDDALTAEADVCLRTLRPACDGWLIDLAPGLSSAVLARIAYQLLIRLGRRPTEGQVAALVRALSNGGGGGRGLWVGKMDRQLWLGPSAPLPGLALMPAPGPGQTVCIPGPLAPGLKAMSLREIPPPIWVRGWRTGDRLVSGGGLGAVWDGSGVPMPLRARVPLIVTERGVAAVVGVRGPWQGAGGLQFSPSEGTLIGQQTAPALLGSGS